MVFNSLDFGIFLVALLGFLAMRAAVLTWVKADMEATRNAGKLK